MLQAACGTSGTGHSAFVDWIGVKIKNIQNLSPKPASEGHVTQSNAPSPLHLLTIEATQDITMCYRLLVSYLVQGTPLLWLGLGMVDK